MLNRLRLGRDADLQGALRDFGDAIRREQDALGRQIVRRADESALVTRRQFDDVLKTVERLIERADESALFYDGVTQFMRSLPRGMDGETRQGIEALTRKLDALQEGVRDVYDRADRRHAETRQAIGALADQLNAQRVVVPTDSWSPDLARDIRDTLRLLRPYAVSGVAKARLGRANDGGYVMLDDFGGVDAGLSLGIDGDDSWDVEIARRGVRVFQYDHTVDRSPTPDDRLAFHKQRVAARAGEGTVTLSELIEGRLAAGDGALILKMDIEGDEWDVLDATDAAALARFRQIVCEFHTLERLAQAEFRERARRCFNKLEENFFVCHVHGNNCGSIVTIGNVPVPGTLEVTFANKARYTPQESGETFPTALDMPNQPGRADIFLGSFRF